MLSPSLIAPLLAFAPHPPAAPPTAVPPANPGIAAPQRSRKKSKATPKVVYYDGEWEAAQKDAIDRNVPILTVAMLDEPDGPGVRDDDGAFREFLRTDEDMARATEEVLFVLVNPETHPIETITVKDEDGQKVEREVCSFFHSDGCTPHKRNWDLFYRTRGTFEGTQGSWSLPEFVISDPQGKELWRKADKFYPSGKQLVKELADAVKQVGPGITGVELAEVRQLCADGREAAKQKDLGAAWRAFAAAAAITESGPLGLEAKTGADEALASMLERVERASALIVPATARNGYEQLVKLEREYADTPAEKDARRAIKAAEKQKDVKDILREFKIELDARALWDELIALEQAGEAGKARSVARKLLAGKYSKTPQAEKAREKYPDL